MGGTLLRKDLDSVVVKVSEETRRSVRVSKLGNSGHRFVDRDFNVAESSLKRVQALKKFVEENHRLALKFDKLVVQLCQLENECPLYDKDRGTLMEFGKDADEHNIILS